MVEYRKYNRLNACLSALFFAMVQVLVPEKAFSCQVPADQPKKISFFGGTLTILPGADLEKFDVETFGLMSEVHSIQCLDPIVDEATLIDLIDSADGLKSLSAGGPGVTDRLIEACSRVDSLQSLDLRGPLDGRGLIDFVDQPIAKSLKYLSLTTEPFPRGGTGFGEVYGLSDQAIKAIAQLDRLEELFLGGCGLNDSDLESIAELSELQVLELDGNPIVGRGLKKFSGHERLRLVSASYCRISDLHLDQFPSLQKLQILNLSGNPLGDTALEQISRVSLPELQRLSLGRTLVTDAGLSSLSAFSSLEELELNDTAIACRQMSKLKDLPIRNLQLSRTACHGEGVDSLSQLKSLRSLVLADTTLSRSDLESLAKLEKLDYLNLAGTQIENQSLGSLKRKLPGVEIDLRHPYGYGRQLIPGGRVSVEQR